MDIINVLKAEASHAPSGVAFCNLGTPGDNVSVRYHNNEGYSPNSYSWYHRDQVITEAQASGLLRNIKIPDNNKEPELFTFSNRWSMKREYGVVRLSKNAGIGVDAYGKWVLRDDVGEAVDMDKYQNDMLDRFEKLIGKPI